MSSSGKIEEAIANYDKALEIHTKNDGFWHSRGCLLMDIGKDKEALVSFELALAICPENNYYWFDYRRSLSKSWENEEAVASFNTQQYQLAGEAYLLGNYEKAATIIDTLVSKFHDDPSVRLLRGHIYCYGLYQYEIGKKEYEYVIEISTDPEFLQFAHSGLKYAVSCLSQMSDRANNEQFNGGDSGGHYRKTTTDSAELLTWQQAEDMTANRALEMQLNNLSVVNDRQLEIEKLDEASITM